MSSPLISWGSHFVNATSHPHDIGMCPHWDTDGIPLIRWIELITGQCVYGHLGEVSWTFGKIREIGVSYRRLPIYPVVAMCADAPNYHQLPERISRWTVTDILDKLVHGMSLNDLFNRKGDITNLLGCILTHQLPFQTLLACYYVLVDSVLMFQMIFYKLLFPPRPPALIPTETSFHSQHRVASHNQLVSPSTSAPVKIHGTRVFRARDFERSVVSIAIFLGFITMAAAEPADLPEDTGGAEWIGVIFAWICCAFYLSSRIPQILENHRRKSTSGVNIALFMAALCGNLCYTIGILTNPLAHKVSERREFLMNALPYLLGSAGYCPRKSDLIAEQSCLISLSCSSILGITDENRRIWIARL